MKCSSLKSFVRLAIFTAIAVSTGQQAVRAEGPETRTITFALRISVSGFEDGLTDFLSDDTIAVLIRDRLDATGTMSFSSNSPACDGADVAGTGWIAYASATIVNLGGNFVNATVYVPNANVPPTRSVVLPQDVVDVRACWLKDNGSGDAFVQQSMDGLTTWAFFIVTAEFRLSE